MEIELILSIIVGILLNMGSRLYAIARLLKEIKDLLEVKSGDRSL